LEVYQPVKLYNKAPYGLAMDITRSANIKLE